MPSPPRPPKLVLVDARDVPLGEASRHECHEGPGRRHRAFTVLVFDRGGALLLARRAAAKPLWAGHWDGTIASHPRPAEPYGDAATRRLGEELDVAPARIAALEVLNRFRYRATDPRGGIEDEVCATVVAVIDGGEVAPAAREVDAARWTSCGALADAVERQPSAFCPWLLLAIALLRDGAPCGDPLVATSVSTLGAAFLGRDLERALAAHAVDAGWGLVE